MSAQTIVLILLAGSVFVLTVLCGGLLAANANARRKRKFARQFEEARIRPVLRSLASISKVRTGLSENLISLALGGDADPDFSGKVRLFFNVVCDEARRAMSEYTRSECVVSIKIILPASEEGGDFLVQTIGRDTASAEQRREIYDSSEPYAYTKHAMIKDLVDSAPQRRYRFSNDLSSFPGGYFNPHPEWQRLFNSSAIHMIADPEKNENESVYGFLMIDSVDGHFDGGVCRDLMEVISSTLYFAVHASAAVELISEERRGDDG